MAAKKSMMFGPAMPLEPSVANESIGGHKADMNSMTDLVRILKDIDASPENIEKGEKGDIGTATGDEIKLGEEGNSPERG